jgi:hypothetical protein
VKPAQAEIQNPDMESSIEFERDFERENVREIEFDRVRESSRDLRIEDGR